MPPVLNSLVDGDARVRYYALEALYNIAKVAREEFMIFFPGTLPLMKCRNLQIGVKNKYVLKRSKEYADLGIMIEFGCTVVPRCPSNIQAFCGMRQSMLTLSCWICTPTMCITA